VKEIKIIPDGMEASIRKLVGTILNKIEISEFHVEFFFLGSESYIIKINKQFSFRLMSSEVVCNYCPELGKHNIETESANFVFLRGKLCRDVLLTSNLLDIEFDDEASVHIAFCEHDFEPIEYIGGHGERHEQLSFYYVL
jgi:hypothetical protein